MIPRQSEIAALSGIRIHYIRVEYIASHHYFAISLDHDPVRTVVQTEICGHPTIAVNSELFVDATVRQIPNKGEVITLRIPVVGDADRNDLPIIFLKSDGQSLRVGLEGCHHLPGSVEGLIRIKRSSSSRVALTQ
jgi:hypothetical protein